MCLNLFNKICIETFRDDYYDNASEEIDIAVSLIWPFGRNKFVALIDVANGLFTYIIMINRLDEK